MSYFVQQNDYLNIFIYYKTSDFLLKIKYSFHKTKYLFKSTLIHSRTSGFLLQENCSFGLMKYLLQCNATYLGTLISYCK